MPVVVITGSTKGVGFALGKEFARRGWSLVLSGRTTASVDDGLARIRAAVPEAIVTGATVDVASYPAQQALWDDAVAAFGRVDLWINNAGLAVSTKSIVDNTSDDVHAMVTTNVLGTMYGSKVAAAGMLVQSGGGRIVNVLGGGSDGRIREGQAVYSSTKRGLDLFTKALIQELDGTHVIVGSVRPGILITEGFVREAREMGDERFGKQRKALSILGDRPDDVAPWIVDQLLKTSSKHGAAISWLTTPKIIGRFATAYRSRSVLDDSGL